MDYARHVIGCSLTLEAMVCNMDDDVASIIRQALTTGLLAMFNSPSHMTLNTDETTLYIADRLNNRVRAVDLSTMAVTTIAGTAGLSESGGTVASDGANAGDVLPGSQVRRCRLQVSKPVLKAPTVSALEATI